MKYGYSFNEEEYHGPCDSIDQAIQEAREHDDYATEVFIGEAITPKPEDFVRADELIEHIQCQDEFSGEWGEDWPEESQEQRDELTAEIRRVFATWLDKHDLRPTFFNVENPNRYDL